MTDRDSHSVFLALPNYDGRVAIGTLFGVLQASANYHVRPMAITSSLLPRCFNSLWAKGIQSKCRYFAMLHADIGPEPGWLDVLINELTRLKAGVVSATVPIKSTVMQVWYRWRIQRVRRFGGPRLLAMRSGRLECEGRRG